MQEESNLIGSKRKECPNCATEVPKDSMRCPICGYEFPQAQVKSGFFKWIAIILIILFLIPLVHLVIQLLK
jgi:predicted amidophosphoribosyltransferase